MDDNSGYIIEPVTQVDAEQNGAEENIVPVSAQNDVADFDEYDETPEEGVYADSFGNITDEDYENESNKDSMRVFYIVAITALCIFVLITGLILAGRHLPEFITFGNNGDSAQVGVIPSVEDTESEDAEVEESPFVTLSPSARPSESTPAADNGNSDNNSSPVTENATQLSVKEIYENCVDCVVGITAEGTTTNIFGQVSTNASTGTGIVYSSDGYILTNYHVVESGSSYTVTLYNGKSYKAKLIGYESANDVALLKIDASGLKKATVGNSDKISVGEDVIVIGNPLGELTYTLTRGVVSALNRVINTDSNPKNMFQIDAAVNSGNSGGPAFDSYGRVIGIVTAKYSADTVEGIGFCIPVNDAVSIAEELKDYGYVRGKAGLEICATDSYLTYGNGWFSSYAIYGVKITYLQGGGASGAAGMKVTDMIVEVNGNTVANVTELRTALKSCSIGDKIEVVAYHSEDGRNFEKKTYSIKLGEYSPLKVPSDYSAEKYGSII